MTNFGKAFTEKSFIYSKKFIIINGRFCKMKIDEFNDFINTFISSELFTKFEHGSLIAYEHNGECVLIYDSHKKTIYFVKNEVVNG